MKTVSKWGVGAILLYLAALFLWIGFGLLAARFERVAFWERKLNPSHVVFWQNGELYLNPPLFTSQMADPHGQLDLTEPDSLGDVNVWVLLLNGFDDVYNVDFAKGLGLDVQSIAKTNPGATVRNSSVSWKFRWHPLPFYVSRRGVALIDARYLNQNYRTQCLDEMVYGTIIQNRDQELWDRCRITN